jgi:hypothetical protein
MLCNHRHPRYLVSSCVFRRCRPICLTAESVAQCSQEDAQVQGSTGANRGRDTQAYFRHEVVHGVLPIGEIGQRENRVKRKRTLLPRARLITGTTGPLSPRVQRVLSNFRRDWRVASTSTSNHFVNIKSFTDLTGPEAGTSRAFLRWKSWQPPSE